MFTIAFRVILFAAKSKRGRKLLLLGLLSAMRLVRSPQARMAYLRTWRIVTDPRARTRATKAVRKAATRARR